MSDRRSALLCHYEAQFLAWQRMVLAKIRAKAPAARARFQVEQNRIEANLGVLLDKVHTETHGRTHE